MSIFSVLIILWQFMTLNTQSNWKFKKIYDLLNFFWVQLKKILQLSRLESLSNHFYVLLASLFSLWLSQITSLLHLTPTCPLSHLAANLSMYIEKIISLKSHTLTINLSLFAATVKSCPSLEARGLSCIWG